MSNLESICQRFRETGLYTHVYVACGYLNGANNLFEYFDTEPQQKHRRVFDLSSLTKALMTTPIMIWLCKQKNLDPKLAALSECFGDQAVQSLGLGKFNRTVASYLRHETGMPAWRNFYVECEGRRQTLKEVIASLNDLGAGHEVYSDVGFLILTDLIEQEFQRPIYEVWKQMCAENKVEIPRGLSNSKELDPASAISTGYCPVRKRTLVGEVHDENCWAFGGITGHAGLFGDGAAVTGYLRNLWQTETGKFVIEQNFEELNSPGESLMGWRKGRDFSAEVFAHSRGCGHLGFTGTGFWVDPKTLGYAVVLTNRVISARISPDIKNFRRQVFRDLWAIIDESTECSRSFQDVTAKNDTSK